LPAALFDGGFPLLPQAARRTMSALMAAINILLRPCIRRLSSPKSGYPHGHLAGKI
jgi:hypothetical protein